MNKVFTLLGVVLCSVLGSSLQAQDQPNTITTAVPF